MSSVGQANSRHPQPAQDIPIKLQQTITPASQVLSSRVSPVCQASSRQLLPAPDSPIDPNHAQDPRNPALGSQLDSINEFSNTPMPGRSDGLVRKMARLMGYIWSN